MVECPLRAKSNNGGEMFKAVCKLGLEGIVSKKLDAPYRSGPSKLG
jgi:ATP-dependent DNA ligase